MSKQPLILLLPLIFFIHISFAQDDAMMEDDAAMEMEESTSMDESSDEPVKGMVASTKYLCELQGLTRRVEIAYDSPTSTVPCSVNYYKDSEAPGEVATLWVADNLEGYCEEKARQFIEKIKSWGWSCIDN